jgi:methionyl-tRNA synthetase
MAEKYFGGKVPVGGNGKRLKEKAGELAGELEKTIPNFAFGVALDKIWELVNIANKLIEESKPWALAKENKTEELSDVIYSLLETLRIVAVAISPFMPETSKRIYEQLGLDLDSVDRFTLADINIWGKLKSGSLIKKSAPLFPRIEAQ